MKKQFVTVTADNHPEWTAKDWNSVWAHVLKLIEGNNHSKMWYRDAFGKDTLLSYGVRFVDWNIYIGVDPASDDSAKTVILEKTPEREKYNELLMSVVCRFPNETRHETALRYIKERNMEVAPAMVTKS